MTKLLSMVFSPRILFFYLLSMLVLCGFTFSSGALAQTSSDQDSDTVEDRFDRCSSTPPGTRVWRSGEWMGCAEGQVRDAAPKLVALNDFYKAIDKCEDVLVGSLSGREIYQGSECESYATDIRSSMRPYLDMGQGDLRNRSRIKDEAHLRDRLKLCLVTAKSIIEIFGNMDQSGCDPYRNQYWDLSNSLRRSVSTSTPSTGSASPEGLYSAGVTYIRSGDIIHGSDGTIYTVSNNQVSGSDGIYTRSGSFTFSPNGDVYISSGDMMHGSNGVICITSGSMTHCN